MRRNAVNEMDEYTRDQVEKHKALKKAQGKAAQKMFLTFAWRYWRRTVIVVVAGISGWVLMLVWLVLKVAL